MADGAVAAARSQRVSVWGNVAAIAGAAALSTLAGWLTTVSLQQDFAAYFTAARARASGLDPYVNQLITPGGPWDGVNVYRHSRFLYPPIVADLFRPLALLPFPWAKAVFTLVSVLGLVAGLRLAVRDEPDSGTRPRTGIALTLAAAWPPVFAALERGQIDLLLFPLLAAAWRWRRRPLLAGPALGLCALGKPFVVGVVLLLVLGRQWRWASATVGALALLAIATLVSAGPALSREYITDVLPRAALYGEGGPEAWMLDPGVLANANADLVDGTARIDGHTYAQQVGDFRRSASLTRLLSEDGPPPLRLAVLGLILAVGGALLGVAAFRAPGSSGWYWGSLLLALIAAPVSWVMSLVWALPLLCGSAPSFRPGERRLTVAQGLTYGAGFLGLFHPAAWPLVGVAGVAMAAIVARRAEATP